MKKTLVAALASLMLAGILCAVDGAPVASSAGSLVVAADGCTPLVIPKSATEHEPSPVPPDLEEFFQHE